MFLIADNLVLEKDQNQCWFAARIGDARDRQESEMVWELRLHSRSRPVVVGDDSMPVSLGVDCSAAKLIFDVADWTELSGKSFEAELGDESIGLFVHQWERLISLEVAFGAVRGRTIQVTVEGRGACESVPELFGDEVTFRIATDVEFAGVFVDAPLNSPAPVSFSEARLRRWLPNYRNQGPKLIEKHADGRLWQVAVHYAPDLVGPVSGPEVK